MNDYSYLMQGLTRVPTTSSTLVSSSRYLNDPRIREWLATHLLRKNGPDAPTPSDPMPLVLALREVQDLNHINELFAAERRKNPALDAWFREGHISTFKREDLKDYPPASTAGIFYKQLMANDLQVDIVPPYKPQNDYQYFFLRAGQTHDLEHILGGGGFDFIGEVVPYYMRLTNLFVHLSAELAGELCVFYMLSSTRILTRAVLHYPQTWLTVLDALERGAQVGRESAPLYSLRFEDLFELTPEAARIKAGIRGVRLADTSAASAQWC